MLDYKVTRKCSSCNNIDCYEIDKYECAFYRSGNYTKKRCFKCDSSKWKSLSCSMIKLDFELMDIWSKDSSLNFLDQDEELIVAEKEYVDLIFHFIDLETTLSYKKGILLLALYALIYDMYEEIIEKDQHLEGKIKEFLLSRIHLIDRFDFLVNDYIKEVVYIVLGIKPRMMKIKVCGMKIPINIMSLSQLPINYMGLIFYPKSPRYIGDLDPTIITSLPIHIDRVGVFVNEDIEIVLNQVEKYKLTYVQLHGCESEEYCVEISNRSEVNIIKAFNVATSDDFKQTVTYEDTCKYFLFDTKTPQHGGSGLKFNWDILNAYIGDIPFFLSGGITADDIASIKKIDHPKLQALDLNSKFEIEPGLKNIDLLDKFIKKLKYE